MFLFQHTGGEGFRCIARYNWYAPLHKDFPTVEFGRDIMYAASGFCLAIGDGAGITRGLMQASVTGIAVAQDIASKMK